MSVRELSIVEARRIAVTAQLLDAARPADLLEAARGLTLLQLDPTAAIAPNADLVLFSRLGSRHEPAELVTALERRRLLELNAMLRPAEDLALYRADMRGWPGAAPLSGWAKSCRDWVDANDACRRDVLARLESQGPLTSRQLPDSCAVPWKSTGWTNNRNVTRLLDFMVARGEVAVAGRRGRERLWDLAERVYPDDPIVPADEAARLRDEKRLRALGIAPERSAVTPGEPAHVNQAGQPVVVTGVKGVWRVDPQRLDRPFTPRTALLSPFDRLVHDRRRATALFGFEYQLEMYKPAAARRWGYFALPILHGDRLIGKLDATADRAAGVLRVHAVHEDEPFTTPQAAAVNAEIGDLAAWLGVEVGTTG